MKIYIAKDDNGTICVFNSEPELRRMRDGNIYMPKDDYADITEINEEFTTCIERELPVLEDEKFRNQCWLEGFLELAAELLSLSRNHADVVISGLHAAGVEPSEFNRQEIAPQLLDVINQYVEQYNKEYNE